MKSDDYSEYVELALQFGEEILDDKEGATFRAMLNCNGSAKQIFGGISIDNFPTDLALIRAYCPDKEKMYR